MIAFAALLERLAFTPSRNARIALLARYFATTPDPDRGVGLAAIAGELRFPAAKAGLIRELAAARTDPVLFELSYDYVGDLAETVALIWPAARTNAAPPSISDVVDTLAGTPKSELPAIVSGWLDASTPSVRLALLKLITGGLRVGVSARLARVALAELSEGRIAVDDLEEIWHGVAPPYRSLFAWLTAAGPRPDPAGAPVFRPPMLAHPLEPADLETLDPADWRAEWKWDGIRVQLVAGPGGRRIFSRGAEDISAAFPDILATMDFHAVLDGELLVVRDGAPAPFADLQRRLNRKTASPQLQKSHPAGVRLYDMLFDAERGHSRAPLRHPSRPAGILACHPGPAAHAALRTHPLRRLQRTRRPARRRPRRGDRGPDAQARRQPLPRRPAARPLVEMEARPAAHRRRADVRPARPRQAQRQLFRLHLRPLARRRPAAGRQGLFRFFRRRTGASRPLDPQPRHRPLRPGNARWKKRWCWKSRSTRRNAPPATNPA